MKFLKETTYNFITRYGIWFLRKFFPEYFASEPLQMTDRYIEYPFVLENLPKTGKILDVGCSGSMFPFLVSALGYETYGIDIRNYYPTERFFFVKGDIKHSVFPSENFDVITAISSIEHIGLKGIYGISEEDVDGDLKAVKEIHRILKPGGIFLMTVLVGPDLQITQNHKIYTWKRIQFMLDGFQKVFLTSAPSNEGDYKLALIKAIK